VSHEHKKKNNGSRRNTSRQTDLLTRGESPYGKYEKQKAEAQWWSFRKIKTKGNKEMNNILKAIGFRSTTEVQLAILHNQIAAEQAERDRNMQFTTQYQITENRESPLMPIQPDAMKATQTGQIQPINYYHDE
tara:strand:- start:482 stop:880 length:399 start_codon:yes stop_codon:yes gene_type:complete